MCRLMKSFTGLALVFVCCGILVVNVQCKEPSKDGLGANRVDAEPLVREETIPPSASSKTDDSATTGVSDFNAFKAAFRMKRFEQKDILQRVKEMKDKKRDGALTMALSAILKSLRKSRQVLMQHNYQIGDWPEVPANQSADDATMTVQTEVRSALSSVIENVALFCDIVLYFPDYVHETLKRGSKESTVPDDSPSQLVKWAFTIANVDKFIFSENDKERMSLALQELRFIPRGEDFTNPNSKEAKVEKLKLELEKKKYESKKNLKEQEFSSEKARLKKIKYEEKRRKRKKEEL